MCVCVCVCVCVMGTSQVNRIYVYPGIDQPHGHVSKTLIGLYYGSLEGGGYSQSCSIVHVHVPQCCKKGPIGGVPYLGLKLAWGVGQYLSYQYCILLNAQSSANGTGHLGLSTLH